MEYGIWEDGAVIAKFTAPMQVISNVPVLVGDALSLQRRVARRSAQRFEIVSGVEPFNWNGNDFHSLVVRSGHFKPIDVKFPQNLGAQTHFTARGSLRATGQKSQNKVHMAPFYGVIPAGYHIKFHNHNKIYMVVKNHSGQGDMEIFPELRQNVDGEVIVKDIIVPMFIDTDTVIGMNYVDGILNQIEQIKLVEVL